MTQIVVHRRHGSPLAEIRRRAETVARRLRDEYGGTYAWEGNTLRFQRTGASGQFTVRMDSFEVRVEIGFLLAPLRSRIEHEVRALCDEHLGGSETSDRGEPTRAARRRNAASRHTSLKGLASPSLRSR
jgi:putative polyhydroxyalkanoate system protein